MSPSGVLSTLRANRGVVVLCVTITLTMLGNGAISPVFPLFVRQFDDRVIVIASAVGLWGVGRVAMGLPGGLVAQKYGRRIVLVGGVSLGTLGSLLLPFSKSLTQLMLFRGLTALGHGAYTVGSTIYLRDVSSRRTRARYQSLFELSLLVGVTIGPLIGGVLAGAYGLRAPLFLQAGFMGLALVMAVAWIPETKGRTEPESDAATSSATRAESASINGIRGLLLHPGFLAVSLFNLMIVFNRQGGRMSLMPLFGEEKGFGPGKMGTFFTATHLPSFFAVLAAGFISDRFGRNITIVPAAMLILFGVLIFAHGVSYPLLLVSGVLMGVGEGLAGPPPAGYVADMAPRGMEGVTLGLYRTIGGSGALIGALFLGALADVLGFEWALGIGGVLVLAAALALMLVAREKSGKPESEARSDQLV